MEKRPLYNHPRYEVSEDGDIYNARTGLKLKKRITERGYYYVTVWDGPGQKDKTTIRVGKFIYNSFNECPCEMEVDHIDQNKLNDNISNLRCVDGSTNSKNRTIYRNKFNLNDSTKKDIITRIRLGETTYQIWKEYGIPTNYLSSVKKRGSWDFLIDDTRAIQNIPESSKYHNKERPKDI